MNHALVFERRNVMMTAMRISLWSHWPLIHRCRGSATRCLAALLSGIVCMVLIAGIARVAADVGDSGAPSDKNIRVVHVFLVPGTAHPLEDNPTTRRADGDDHPRLKAWTPSRSMPTVASISKQPPRTRAKRLRR
jgi:hypothetical protein